MSSQDQMVAGTVPAQASSSDTVASTRQKQSRPEPKHKDKLGRLIQVGDFVAYPDGNSLCVGKIVKLNPKMVKVLRLPKATWDQNKYPTDVVKLEASDMTWFMLKNGA